MHNNTTSTSPSQFPCKQKWSHCTYARDISSGLWQTHGLRKENVSCTLLMVISSVHFTIVHWQYEWQISLPFNDINTHGIQAKVQGSSLCIELCRFIQGADNWIVCTGNFGYGFQYYNFQKFKCGRKIEFWISYLKGGWTILLDNNPICMPVSEVINKECLALI